VPLEERVLFLVTLLTENMQLQEAQFAHSGNWRFLSMGASRTTELLRHKPWLHITIVTIQRNLAQIKFSLLTPQNIEASQNCRLIF